MKQFPTQEEIQAEIRCLNRKIAFLDNLPWIIIGFCLLGIILLA